MINNSHPIMPGSRPLAGPAAATAVSDLGANLVTAVVRGYVTGPVSPGFQGTVAPIAPARPAQLDDTDFGTSTKVWDPPRGVPV